MDGGLRGRQLQSAGRKDTKVSVGTRKRFLGTFRAILLAACLSVQFVCRVLFIFSWRVAFRIRDAKHVCYFIFPLTY